MGFETVEALMNFVHKEETHVKPEKIINNLSFTSIRCGDPLLGYPEEGVAAIVGGAVNAHRSGWLERFIAARRGKGGSLEGHLNCGWMLSQGLTTLEQQQQAIEDLRAFVQAQNALFGTQFEVPEPEIAGSAQPFMDG